MTLLLVAPLLAAPQPCHAQTGEERDRRARSEFHAGVEAFDHGDFHEAALRFESAYQLSNRPQLLYNLGTTYDRLHRWTEARDAFQQYLEAFPNAPEHDEIVGRLRVIEDEIRREDEEDRQTQSSSSSPPPERIVIVHDARPQVIVREVQEPPRTFRNAGFVLGGLAIIAGAVSGTVGVLTNLQYDSLANSCGMMPGGCPQASIDDINLRATVVNIFIVTAGVLAAASIVSFIVDATRSHQPATVAHPASAGLRLVPWVRPDANNGAAAGLGLAGTL